MEALYIVFYRKMIDLQQYSALSQRKNQKSLFSQYIWEHISGLNENENPAYLEHQSQYLRLLNSHPKSLIEEYNLKYRSQRKDRLI